MTQEPSNLLISTELAPLGQGGCWKIDGHAIPLIKWTVLLYAKDITCHALCLSEWHVIAH